MIGAGSVVTKDIPDEDKCVGDLTYFFEENCIVINHYLPFL